MNIQRLKELRKDKHGMTQAEAAKRLGVALTTYASYEQGHRQPDPDMLAKIANLFHTSVDYIIGTNSSASQSEGGDPGLIIADDYIKVYGDIHAGEAAWASQDIIGRIPVTKELIMRYGRNNLFALRIKGDSMNQVLLNGYVAIFAKDCALENGDIVAVLIDGDDATIKRYKQTSAAVIFEPESSNPVHRPYFFPKTGPQDFKILGKYLYATTQLL